uniref:Uncharacterized protein n=1 Tax=viral metagenome TaxID=1070528 RepID=A0A2V0RN71_9ZZZZ
MNLQPNRKSSFPMLQHSRNRRLSIMQFSPQIGRKPRITPGTGAPFVNPGSATTPTPQTSTFASSEAGPQQDAQTAREPMTAEKPSKRLPTTRKQTDMKTKRRSNKKENDFMYVPRGGRPRNDDKPAVKFTSGDEIPFGEQPFRDGPATITPSKPMGKIGELPNLLQEQIGWNTSAQVINNIRFLIQVVEPAFFNQLPSSIPNAADQSLNRNHDRIFNTLFNQMRELYQSKFNINTAFVNAFTYENVFIYFHDVFALHAELVCFYQRAAYYRNLDSGMENILLDHVANVLSNDDFDSIRNKMARALRFSFLPQSIIDETYEIFQTYRLGNPVTSGSIIFITPHMSKLLLALSSATNLASYNTAKQVYETEIDAMIDRVLNGRPNNTTLVDGIPRRWRTSNAAGNDSSSQDNSVSLYPVGQGGLSRQNMQFLNSVFTRIAPMCNLTMLNNQKRGNSESHYINEICDIFNNQMNVFGAGTYLFPKIVSVGNNQDISPSNFEGVIFASETDSESITFKQVHFQAERFAGGGQLLFRTSSSTNLGSRQYAVERARKPDLTESQDLRFDLRHHYTQVSNNAQSFVQDNYVTKVFKKENNTEFLSVNNTDSTSASQWFLTFGNLMDKQYEYGVDLLK